MTTGRKARAGVGDTLTVAFLNRDKQERKALHMSHMLAKMGRRSLYVVTFLSALWDVCGDTGDVPELSEITNAIHALKRTNGRNSEGS